MSKTVVGLFESMREAEDVKAELVSQGYAASDIKVFQNGTQTAGNATGYSQPVGEEGIGEKIKDFFKSLMGEHDIDHSHYSTGVTSGSALLAINVRDEQASFTANALTNLGAINVENGAGAIDDLSTPAPTYGSQAALTSAGAVDAYAPATEQAVVPIAEEELVVGKREVQRGGVRIYSHVIEQPVQTSIDLREDHVRVQRRAVDRPATEADFNSGNQTIEMIETAEEAVVGKTSRVVGEVLVGKETTQRTETISDTVRKTEVDEEPVRVTETTSAYLK